MLVAEDARPSSRAEASALLKGLASPAAAVVRQAVRALGRLERAEFLPDILTALAHADPGVRAEAANAAAQAAGDLARALAALRARVEVERDPAVRGALCDALGRLPYPAPAARVPVERLLSQALDAERAPVTVRLGAARGLESLVRRARGTPYVLEPDTLRVLRTAALGTGRPAGTEDDDRVRRVAVLTLNAATAVDATYERLVIDRDAQVRRLAVAAAVGHVTPDVRERLVRAGLADRSPTVRYEALRAHARHLAADSCQPEIDALKDGNAHVAVLAIDQLATVCPGNAGVVGILDAIAARRLAPAPGSSTPSLQDWNPPAHALAALARRAPDIARPRLGGFVADSVWQVRVYAALAAAALGDAATLGALATDNVANVRAAAIDGLRQVAGHAADAIYRDALSRLDYPVVMAAARALESTPEPDTGAVALMRALTALSLERRDTSRDARLAILDRLAQVGGAPHAEALTPLLADADPRVAARAAEVLTAWTGNAQLATTTRHLTVAVPPARELEALPAGIRVTMASGGSFDIRFFTDETPISVWRVVRLVRQGYYNGLTWHRIVPNFIVQGGSPGADEFVGDGPFMRDELSMRSHLRGTVGISTRGRDTGDAQWFVNLVDSPRLDHDYTIIGHVVAGMDVVDGMVEGDVMVRVVPVPAGGRTAGQCP